MYTYKKNLKGFTLTEVIITMVLVVILSLISLPLYKGRFSNYAKISEGYALLGTIRAAQMQYYNEHGYFLSAAHSFSRNYSLDKISTSNDPVLGVNAINNKYFSMFNYDTHNNFDNLDWKHKICIRVFSTKAGTITQLFDIATRSQPVVIGGNTDFSF